MNIREIAGDTAVAFLSQGVSFIVSAATSLLVPKILGIDGFGYWQLFLFYSTYVGFCHFGLNDGMYLLNGGIRREQADKKSINSQMLVGIVFELVLSAVFCMATVIGPFERDREFVLISVAVYMVILNTFYYLGYMFQAFGETRIYSQSILISRVAFVVPLVALLITSNTDFRFYVMGQIFSQVIALIWCVYMAKDVLSSGLLAPSESIVLALRSVRAGIKLMISNIASTLILGILRFVVDARWGISTFGQLSLSLSLINFALAFINQVGMVLFPALRRAEESELKGVFQSLRDIMALFMPACYPLSIPIIWVLSIWLPEYTDSLHYLVWLLPICIFDAQMSLLNTTYFKVLRAEGALLAINLFAVSVSAVGIILGVYVIESFEFAIAMASISIVLRSVVGERMIADRLNLKVNYSLIASEVCLSFASVFCCANFGEVLSFLICLTLYGAYLFAYRKRLRKVLAGISKMIQA